MNRHDFQKLARALHDGYANVHQPAERTGYNRAIRAVIGACAEINSDFDAVRFASAIYSGPTSSTRYARTHRPQ